MERFDIAVIGTGPAGVSAAITAKIRNKNVILLGSRDLSPKISKAHLIENYPGLPAISGAELAAKLKEHLAALDISITDKQVGAVYAMGEHFVLQAGEDMIEAKTVIAATGIVQSKPLTGEDKFLGRGVSYCATCDARLYKGKTVAVLGYSADAADEAEYLAEVVDKVVYLPLGGGLPSPRENIVVTEEKPVEISGESSVNALVTDKAVHDVSCVFILRDAVMPDKLIPGIETDGPHIRADLNMQTNIPGLFVCGDIAGKPYQYVKAAGQGNVAALSAISCLNKNKGE
ncbi:MAG: NAD(P)/FAD-dependent oxidoreductase [Ruminococcus sp.]|nr:NAD(P)/FAD-dependent oxidoreductase [Ruminococcus sp.]